MSSTTSMASSSLSSGTAPPSSSAQGGGSVGSVPNVPGTSLGSTLDGLRTLVGKRITAWTYLKNAGEGRVYWFNVRRPLSLLSSSRSIDLALSRA